MALVALCVFSVPLLFGLQCVIVEFPGRSCLLLGRSPRICNLLC